MSFSEIIVIYLAFGAPFAVHRATSAGNMDWLVLCAALLAWPVFALQLAFNSIRTSSPDKQNFIDELRNRIEEIAFSDDDVRSVFEFREIFYRFVGLSMASSEPEQEQTHELFAITAHPNSKLASKCLGRKNRVRLARHAEVSRTEFVSAVGSLSTDDARGLAGMVSELSSRVGKEILPHELSFALSGSAEAAESRMTRKAA